MIASLKRKPVVSAVSMILVSGPPGEPKAGDAGPQASRGDA